MSSALHPGRREIAPEDRYARVCPDHPPTELQGLDCPHGHRAAGWLIYDRVKETVTKGGDVDEDFRRGKPRPMPATAPEYEERRRQMRARIESHPAANPERQKPGPKAGAKPGTALLGGETYTNPTGTTALRVELRRVFLTSISASRFRVVWRTQTGKQQLRGTTHDGIDEGAARQALQAAKKVALENGWIPRPIGRQVEMKPIPMAPKK